jgi:uncharacterized membrane protein YtjA (UPF0391 family)
MPFLSASRFSAATLRLTHLKGHRMLRWALIFLVVAIVAAIFGFGGIAGDAAYIAKILCILFVVVFLVSLVIGLVTGKRVPKL